ncbi:ArsR/SmtB family transcription factor [Nonomuraea cavernae]|uniref:ArsR/SmtB family transcription factor n=1 Tax=Nonomuraea cavernae TaxID=2045107 RepID=UPI00166EE160|nr:metalloregulator ArsR/SmtB family transcription factor [Nonomuraea cavernae]MCA2185182.1 metalloregulator ArsR/SmtB family transcription factor [Nonomuraea cavernae]
MAEDIFKALSDPTRRHILDELVERDGQTLFEICARLTAKHGLGLSRQAVSQHLAVLESAGLIHARRQGRYKFHDVNTEPLEQIVTRWLRPDTPEGTS